ncbi:MAG: glycosyltransferase [Pseudomonadota bacterium]
MEIGKNQSTLCLSMIVKNEAHVIRRCLESVLPFIDHWVICDTGSTDGTQNLIREIMKDKPGELHERAWENFGHNRQEALALSAGKADYVLIIDADEWLECRDGFDFRTLQHDAYYISKKQPGQQYSVCNIVRNDTGWHWVGVLHEYLANDRDTSFGTIEAEDALIMVRQEGARSLDPDTYRKDAKLLIKALKKEPDNTRYQFYLAQSWRDANEPGFAIKNYRKRIAMGGWQEEVFFSRYQIALQKDKRGDAWEECLIEFLKAYEHTPVRAEPLYMIGMHYAEKEQWELAWLYLNRAATMPEPEHCILFIDRAVYAYRAKLEAAVAAFYLGLHEEAINLNDAVIACSETPERLVDLAKSNRQLSVDLLNRSASNAA